MSKAKDNWRITGTGSGRFRFNEYGMNNDDLIVIRQHRFKTMKDAVRWLCWMRNVSVDQVKPGEDYYEIDTDGNDVGGDGLHNRRPE